MNPKKTKKYLLVYELEIEAKSIRKAEEIGDQEETRMRARLKKIVGKDESCEKFYDDEPSVVGISSFKNKRK
jgi:hypothetical protein